MANPSWMSERFADQRADGQWREETMVFIGDPTTCPRCGASVQVRQGIAQCSEQCGWTERRSARRNADGERVDE